MTEKTHRFPGRNSIQFKIGFLMTAAVILLTATCYLLYRNLSTIVTSIRIDDNPELRLLSIRDISMDLGRAGNSVRIYTITGNRSDIKPYYKIISNIDDKVSKLRSACSSDSALLRQTDMISRLIEDNIVMWNKILVLNKDNGVMEYMKELSDQFSVASVNNQKRGILKRVFSRRPENLPDEKEIIENLNEVARQDSSRKDELLARESQLAITSNEITGKFYDLISKMENEVYENIRIKADNAGAVAGKTYRLLILLALSGGLLAILVLYILIRYVRNAYAYQAALEYSRDEAEKLSRTKEMFMANMSHEIRTPVTAISGFTEQLLHETLNENTAHSLNIIKSSSDHLLKIIDDILDFSKLQNNKLILEKAHFSINKILGEVSILFEKQALQNNTRLTFTLDPGTPPFLLGDPFRLKQIIINLVSNSVKFTKDGRVDVKVSSKIKTSDEVELVMEFSDTGIGIDESKIEIIFEDFTQAEMNTTRKYGGTGLGLSIVKRLIEIQHGTIELKSKRNQGTTIMCRIPFLIGDGNQVRKEISSSVPLPGRLLSMKFLIADDEEYNRLLFKKILDRWRITCREVESGMEALEVLKEEAFDFLFIDMRMPGIDGLKTTRFIRQEMKINESDMPVVIVSAVPLNEDFKKYREEGVNGFLQKPFSEEMLLNTIMEVIGSNYQMLNAERFTEDRKTASGKPKIDLRNLYHIAGGDEQFVKQMLTSFITSTGSLLEDLQKAVAARNTETAAELAHKMMPPCRHLGAMDLYNILGIIEKGAGTDDPADSFEKLAENAIEEFGKVSVLLNEHIAGMKRSP